ncbi:MAG TPA: extracellular solute-binding protein [Candidatus Eisenbacteria bacterium]|jgi:ABC-type glycerol-3-phosphate transport system substrate-binding protein
MIWRGRHARRTLGEAARLTAARLTAAAVLALVSLLTLSCARKGARQRQEIVAWVSWPVEAIQPLARRFETENPGILVSLRQIPWRSGADSVTAAIKTGGVPDLCQLHSSQLPPFMAGNTLSDWSAGVADLRSGLRGWDMCMLGDAIYGLPWLVRAQVLYYNKALFARAGLDSARAPDTWEDLRASAVRVQRLRGGVHGYGFPAGDSGAALERIMPFVWGNGGEFLAAGLDSSRFGSLETVQSLEFLLSLRPFSLLASPDSLEREFLAGRLGVLLASSALPAHIADSAPALRYGVTLAPRPAEDRGTHASVADGEVLVSFTGSRRKEDALKLARFLVRPENAHALATALRSVQPANLGADTTAWYRARPEQQIVFHQYDTARFLPNFRQRIALEDTLHALWDDALGGRRSAARMAALVDTFITTHLGSR